MLRLLKRPWLWLLAIALLVTCTVPFIFPDTTEDKAAQIAFAAISPGATEQEVEAILGGPDAVGGAAQGGKLVFWNVRTRDNRGVGMFVTFDKDGRVCGKKLQEEPASVLRSAGG